MKLHKKNIKAVFVKGLHLEPVPTGAEHLLQTLNTVSSNRSHGATEAHSTVRHIQYEFPNTDKQALLLCNV